MTSRGRDRPQRIVVGVDGSTESQSALPWAADLARLRDAELEVVLAWELPFIGLAASFAPEPTGLPSAETWRQRAEHTLAQSLNEVFDGEPPAKLTRLVEQGNPSRVLLTRAHNADLLVLDHAAAVGSPVCSSVR